MRCMMPTTAETAATMRTTTTSVRRELRETRGVAVLSGLVAGNLGSSAFIVVSPCASFAPIPSISSMCDASSQGLIRVLSLGPCERRIVAMHQREEDRNEGQRAKCGQQQPADDGASQRRILLAAIAQAQRHGNHSDD